MNAIHINKLFVYGTLKSSFHNEYILTECGGTFDKHASISGYAMWDMGSFPAIVPVKGVGSRIQGEVWNVNEKVLARTDILEGVNSNFYKRGTVTTNDGYLCWVYYRELGNDMLSYMRVPSGFWKKHGNNSIVQFTNVWPHIEPLPAAGTSVACYTPPARPAHVAPPPRERFSPVTMAFGGTRRPEVREEPPKEASNG